MTPANAGGRRRVAGERGRGRTAPPVEPKRPAPKPPRKEPGAAAKTASTASGARSTASDPSRSWWRRGPLGLQADGGPAPSRVRVLLLAALVTLTVAAMAASLVVLAVDRQQQRLANARTAATEAARSAAEVVLSYDYETLDEDFAAAQAVSTGAFKEEYAETSENAIRSVATETQAQVSAEPLSAGVVSATDSSVVVLLFVDQTTLSNRLDQPKTDQNRVRFTMVRTTVDGADRWLVSEVDAL